ncbi:MAG: FkbM family methyltransferase [Vicingaceae bacterium]|nr:FkbM family methyltransferase [Vicingaceae bacterium]
MFKKIAVPIRYIYTHPLTKNSKLSALLRFFNWQITSRLSKNNQQIKWIGNLKLSMHKGMHGATGCIYVGLPEFNDMSFLLHFLDAKSNFIDIGANVGVYSLLAAGTQKSKTIAIEPIPQTFQYLTTNIQLNQLENLVNCYNIGLSDKKGELHFTKDKDTINHVTAVKSENTINVKVDTLDNLLSHTSLSSTLIKLDVEGFEYHVLSGGSNTLNNENVMALIVELNGSSDKYELSDEMVDKQLVTYGFEKYDYNPFTRELTALTQFHHEANTLYIRNSKLSAIKEKLKAAPSFQILNKTI